jgi:hypothetical protein
LKEITDRIGVHKVGLTFLQEIGWIEREQTVSDYGIDMHVEIVNNEEATGQLIALQIKSGESYFKNTTDKTIIYYGKKRHLDYWQFHSLPVLILLYHPILDKVYWQKISSKNVQLTEKSWKLIIPKTNILSKSSKAEIEKYYYNRNYFTILKIDDNSHGTARIIAAKILVDSKAMSKVTMIRMIPYFVESLKKSDYFRNEITKKSFQGQEADVVFLYFYHTIQQSKRGSPFCSVNWNSENCIAKVHLPKPDKIIRNIEVKWESNFESLEELMNKDQMSKGEFFKFSERIFKTSSVIVEEVRNQYQEYKNSHKNIEVFRKNSLKYDELISIIYFENSDKKFPPFECIEAEKILNSFIAFVHNIFVVLNDKKRDERNLKYMISMYLEEIDKNSANFKYEKNKIK